MTLGPLMLDVEGGALTPADRDLLRHPAVGGVLLFSRNYEEPLQLAALVEEIHALRKPRLLVAVDQEGGRVQRFRRGFTELPPMRWLGRRYDAEPREAQRLARHAGWLLGAELRACGVDFSFAPVLDLDWGVSEVIGDRAFHADAEIVGVLATELMRGMRDAGMAAVGKHFPGHGAVVADSHEELPADRREFRELLDDLAPFERLIRAGLPALMTAHVVYESCDPLPATFSAWWLRRQLRERMDFNGAVFSDDLSMQAAAGLGEPPERAVRALAAGCDMVLVCNDRAGAEQTAERLGAHQHPPSLVRLASLHGRPAPARAELVADERWARIRGALDQALERPPLELDA